MAANSSVTGGLARFGKRLAHQVVSTRDLAPAVSVCPAFAAFWRNLHNSLYDKNEDEHVCPAVVPDEIIKQQSEKYWAPNPKTGVFGPAKEPNPADGGGDNPPASAAESVLEQKAFFRPLENLEKPEHP